MRSQFSWLEARVEALVEGLFANRLHPQDLAVQLARALEDSASAGRPPATRYLVRLNPAEAERLLQAQPDLAESLAQALVQAAREAQFTLPRQPEIIILPAENVKAHGVVVWAETQLSADTSVTQGLTPPPSHSPTTAPFSAFLILNGDRTIPIDKPVVTLGRRTDNHIVLDNLAVSRTHAQIRLRFGRYVLYDLGSRGGTFVNGRRIEECVLQPGDVISLGQGGAQLIYGEGKICQVPPSEQAMP